MAAVVAVPPMLCCLDSNHNKISAAIPTTPTAAAVAADTSLELLALPEAGTEATAMSLGLLEIAADVLASEHFGKLLHWRFQK